MTGAQIPLILACMGLSGLATMGWGQWLSPPDPGPLTVFTLDFMLLLLALFVLGALLLPFLATGLVWLAVRACGGRLDFESAWRIHLLASTPLLLVGTMIWMPAALWAGEVVWRGGLPHTARFLEAWFVPIALLWYALRMGQAFVCRGGARPLQTFALWVVTGTVLTVGSLTWLRLMDKSPDEQMNQQEAAVSETMGFLVAGRLQEAEKTLTEALKSLPRRATQARAELLFLRIDVHTMLPNLLEARADALRVQRMFPRGNPWERLARGVNLILQDRPDLGGRYLEDALLADPELHPANRWLAKLRMEIRPAEAEIYARNAWRTRPHVLHLREWIEALYRQQKYRDIWDALAGVYQQPDAWFTPTLLQGGIAAIRTGNPLRGRLLLSKAIQRNPSLVDRIPVSYLE